MSTYQSLMIFTVMTFLSVFFMKMAAVFKDNNLATVRHFGNNGLVFFFFTLSIIPLVLVSGFRINVGTDFTSYVLMFENPAQYTGITNLFRTILVFLNNKSINVQELFVISSAVIIFSYSFVALKLSKKPSVTLLLFIIGEDYFVSMNIVRQFIATGIVLLAFMFYQRKDIIPAIGLNIVALLIHPVVLVFDIFLFFMWFVRKSSISREKIVCFILLTPFLALLVPVIKKIIALTSFGKFLSNSYSQFHYRWTLLMIIVYLIILILFTMFANFKKNSNTMPVKMFVCANLVIIYILICSYFISANTYRIIYVITPIMYLYYPNIIDTIEDNATKLVVNYTCIITFLLGTIIMITHYNNNVIPYYNVLFNY